jgi:flagellin-like hook-associated protein FlgL
MKNEVIKEIQSLKEIAINAGFDFPTQDPETASLEELTEFLEEIKQYLKNESFAQDATNLMVAVIPSI